MGHGQALQAISGICLCTSHLSSSREFWRGYAFDNLKSSRYFFPIGSVMLKVASCATCCNVPWLPRLVWKRSQIAAVILGSQEMSAYEQDVLLVGAAG
jgi:hypothetical protein